MVGNTSERANERRYSENHKSCQAEDFVLAVATALFSAFLKYAISSFK
jgi:hypothetical protein